MVWIEHILFITLQRTLGSLPPFGCCEECCYGYGRPNISWELLLSLLLGLDPEVGLLDRTVLGTTILFPPWLHRLTSPQQCAIRNCVVLNCIPAAQNCACHLGTLNASWSESMGKRQHSLPEVLGSRERAVSGGRDEARAGAAGSGCRGQQEAPPSTAQCGPGLGSEVLVFQLRWQAG